MDQGTTALLSLALAAIMLALGLGLTPADFRRVLDQPRIFAAGAVAQMVLLPTVAFALTKLLGLAPELALGLMILALCPGGATSNLLTRVGRGDVALSISLTAVISVVSVFTLPPLAAFFARHFLGVDAGRIDVSRLSLSMVAITLVPVAAGMALRRLWPAAVKRAEPMASRVAAALAAAVILGLLAGNWRLFVDNLRTVGVACTLLLGLMLALGLWIGRLAGASHAQSTALAIDTGLQNGALGITVGALIAGLGTADSAMATLAIPSGVYGILMYLVGVPFALWRGHRLIRSRP